MGRRIREKRRCQNAFESVLLLSLALFLFVLQFGDSNVSQVALRVLGWESHHDATDHSRWLVLLRPLKTMS